MIAKLSGKIIDIFNTFIILDVNGVGYRVELNSSKKGYLVEQNIDLYIHTHVKEQELRLFGLSTRQDFQMFEKLLEVNGVGPKAAMILIEETGVDNIITALVTNDHKLLKAKGIGNKTAQKILIELKTWYEREGKLIYPVLLQNGANENNILINDLQLALEQLGFSNKEISAFLGSNDFDDTMNLAELIKVALKHRKL